MKLREAEVLVEKALGASTAEEVGQMVDDWLHKHTPDLALFLEESTPKLSNPQHV
jgi:hypothetical protein